MQEDAGWVVSIVPLMEAWCDQIPRLGLKAPRMLACAKTFSEFFDAAISL